MAIVKSHICPLPWTHLSTEANGSVRPCCIHQQKLPDGDTEFAKVDKVSLKDLFQSQSMQKLRQDFRENKKPKACHMCWDDEAHGKESKRQMSIRFMELDDKSLNEMVQSEPKNLSYLQLIMTNQCNLKCRTCNPVASSKWIAEGRERGLYLYKYNENREVFGPDSILFKTKEKWIPHLKYLEIMGGEPFLQKDVENLLYQIAEQKYSQNMRVFISSNATHVPSQMIEELCGQYKYLGVSLSIDGIQQRYEYLRHGAKWELVEKNLEKYDELNMQQPESAVDSNFIASVQITISMLNIFYMPEVFIYFADKFPKMKVSFNLVYYPIEYDCVHLPDRVKKAIRFEYEKYRSQETIWNQLQMILNHLENKKSHHFTYLAGLVAIMDGDRYRKESFAKTFSEYFVFLEKDWKMVQDDYSFIKMTAQKKQYLMIDNSMEQRQSEIFKKNIAF